MSGSNMNHNGEGFKKLVSRRPDYLLRILKKYPKVIFTDIDTIWFKDPRPYLTGDYDFWAQIDGIIDGKPYFSGFIPYFCTGFLALQATGTSMNLLKKWSQVLGESVSTYFVNRHQISMCIIFFSFIESKPHLNQISFQKVVFELSGNGKVLPMDKFSPGNIYFETLSNEDRNSVIMVHNNHIKGKAKKIQRFEHFQLWTLSEGKFHEFDSINHVF